MADSVASEPEVRRRDWRGIFKGERAMRDVESGFKDAKSWNEGTRSTVESENSKGIL